MDYLKNFLRAVGDLRSGESDNSTRNIAVSILLVSMCVCVCVSGMSLALGEGKRIKAEICLLSTT